MTWHKWFIPHRDTHQKAHLISWKALSAYLAIFILLQGIFSFLKVTNPGILGTSSSITTAKIIELTNQERSKLGLPALQENSALDVAAEAKANNMFEENYWAHFAPSGKDPWGFIQAAGYSFSVAGENLAKNFQNSDDVVAAWMASPTHRENIVNAKYRDIGIAVMDGTLNGEQTTLVVQMFGTTPTGLAQDLPQLVGQAAAQLQPSNLSPAPSVVPSIAVSIEPSPQLVAQASSQPIANEETSVSPTPRPINTLAGVSPTKASSTPNFLIDPFAVSKTYGLTIISLVMLLLIVDFVILRRRRVHRLSSHHLAHFALLSVAAATIISAGPGSISDKGISVINPTPDSQFEERLSR